MILQEFEKIIYRFAQKGCPLLDSKQYFKGKDRKINYHKLFPLLEISNIFLPMEEDSLFIGYSGYST